MGYINIFHLGNKHQQLIRIVDYYNKELEVYEKVLNDVADKNITDESREDVTHFQNRFNDQHHNIEDLKHQINVNKFLVFKDAKHHAGKVEETLVQENYKIENEVIAFERSIMNLKHDFKKYLMKWL